jgi:hypothetical protein
MAQRPFEGLADDLFRAAEAEAGAVSIVTPRSTAERMVAID